MERNVSMAMARAIVDGAVEQCQKDGHRVVVVVVDRAGQMVAMQRDDGTNPHNFELARRKAYTSHVPPDHDRVLSPHRKAAEHRPA